MFLKQKKSAIIMGLLLLAPLLALAQPDFGTGYLGGTTLPVSDLREVAVNLINILLSILGTVFLLLVLYGLSLNS